MRNKKSIELSMNFIVTIIISVVIFGFGIYFISNLSSEAKSFGKRSIGDLDKKIGEIVCEGFDRVCISTEKKTIQKNSYDVFGVKVLNVLDSLAGSDSRSFYIEVSPPNQPAGLLGYDKNNNPIMQSSTFQGLNIAPPGASPIVGARPFSLKKNEEANIAFAVEVPANAPSGLYILNVDIKTTYPTGIGLYSSTQKLYVEVP